MLILCQQQKRDFQLQMQLWALTGRETEACCAVLKIHLPVLPFVRRSVHLADDCCCLVTDARPRILRSADTRTLLFSRTQTNLGDGAISAAGHRVCMKLPTNLRHQDLSYSRCRQSLRTFLFGQLNQRSVSLPFHFNCVLEIFVYTYLR